MRLLKYIGVGLLGAFVIAAIARFIGGGEYSGIISFLGGIAWGACLTLRYLDG